MRAFTAILILLTCQQLTSAIPTFEEFKKLRGQSAEATKEILDDMRAKINVNIPGMPPLPEFQLTERTEAGVSTSMGERKKALAEMRAKLDALRAGADLNVQKPSKEFFAEMKKTLEESLKVNVVEFKAPEVENLDAFRAATRKNKPPTVVKRMRNIENYTAEILALHEENLELHRFMLEGTHEARIAMVENIYEIFDDMMALLSRTTEHIWMEQTSVQAALNATTGSQTCINDQREIFTARSRYYGDEMNRCTFFTNTHAREYLQRIFYPTLSRAINTVNGHQYMILEIMSRTNVARDQELSLELLKNDFTNTRDRWANYWQVVLSFEDNRFDDELVWERAELVECLNYIETGYSEAADAVRDALGDC